MDLNFQMQRLNANLRIINEEDEFKKMCQTKSVWHSSFREYC